MSTYISNTFQLFKCSVWTIQVLKDWRFLRIQWLSASTYGDSTQSAGPQRECRGPKKYQRDAITSSWILWKSSLPSVRSQSLFEGRRLSHPSVLKACSQMRLRLLEIHPGTCSWNPEVAGNPIWQTSIKISKTHRVGFDPHVLVGNTENVIF
jgi:hypothetical protein